MTVNEIVAWGIGVVTGMFLSVAIHAMVAL